METQQPSTIYSAAFRVGAYTCSMTLDVSQFQRGGLSRAMTAVWEPEMPLPRSLTAAELDQYRNGRNALMAKVAHGLGGNILVLE
jgi:hypothetical protein